MRQQGIEIPVKPKCFEAFPVTKTMKCFQVISHIQRFKLHLCPSSGLDNGVGLQNAGH
jgi:hypothetical protein